MCVCMYVYPYLLIHVIQSFFQINIGSNHFFFISMLSNLFFHVSILSNHFFHINMLSSFSNCSVYIVVYDYCKIKSIFAEL